MDRYSERCEDVKTFWDRTFMKCEPCPIEAGYEVTINCGYDDYGGRHEVPNKKCPENKFNDGSSATCRPCTECSPEEFVTKNCTSATDTQCQLRRMRTTQKPFTTASKATASTISLSQKSSSHGSTLYWTVPLALLILLLALSAYIIYKKRKRGLNMCKKRSPFIKDGFSALSTPDGHDLEHILSPNILSAPLQTVLDNLDVLEELVILLDPETHGVKNTKHLASHCSFSSTWINYTYSMKDSKSPLKAVLDGVSSRHPDWTVGHLAQMLRLIERNDAITVLAKLRLNSAVV